MIHKKHFAGLIHLSGMQVDTTVELGGSLRSLTYAVWCRKS